MAMLFSTPTQYCVLALLLVAGWLLGLASSSGGQRWRDRYTAERDAHAATRREVDTRRADADKRVADAERGQGDRLTAANSQIADLQRENDRLRAAVPVTAATIMPPAGGTTVIRPGAATEVRSTYPDRDPGV